MTEQIAGFYSILHAHDETLARVLVCPIDKGGAGSSVLQVRVKPERPVTTAEIVSTARMARRVTAEYGALVIVNDRIDIALAVEADGVHLGQEDLPLADARAILRHVGYTRPFLIGVSTHNPDELTAALQGGADYVGYGPVFSTTTKSNPDPVQGVSGLRRAVEMAGRVPVVAIGGIGPENADRVAATGAAAACSISGVNFSQNQALAGARIGAAFGRGRPASGSAP